MKLRIISTSLVLQLFLFFEEFKPYCRYKFVLIRKEWYCDQKFHGICITDLQTFFKSVIISVKRYGKR